MLPSAHIEALNEKGFIAVSSDYRLSPTISVLDGAVSDSVAAYEWAQNQLPTLLESEHGIRVDRKNIVTLGHSCGGGLALRMVICRFYNRYLDEADLMKSRLPALTHQRLSSIFSDLNTSVTPSITPARVLSFKLVHPLYPRPNSSTRSSTRFPRLPQRVHLSDLMGLI